MLRCQLGAKLEPSVLDAGTASVDTQTRCEQCHGVARRTDSTSALPARCSLSAKPPELPLDCSMGEQGRRRGKCSGRAKWPRSYSNDRHVFPLVADRLAREKGYYIQKYAKRPPSAPDSREISNHSHGSLGPPDSWRGKREKG